jgi:hypothetical protein
MKRTLYTTSEYLEALVLQCDGNLYACKGKEFGFFSSAEAAEYDAQWMADYYKREGIKKRKPTVYRIRLERM